MMTMTIKWMVVSLINYTSACMESMQHDNERSFALNHTSKRIPSIPDPMSTNSDGAVSLLNHWCFYNDVRILIYVKFWACKDLLSLKGETHKNFWITYRSKIKKKKKGLYWSSCWSQDQPRHNTIYYLRHRSQYFLQLLAAQPRYVVHTLFPYWLHVLITSRQGGCAVGVAPTEYKQWHMTFKEILVQRFFNCWAGHE